MAEISRVPVRLNFKTNQFKIVDNKIRRIWDRMPKYMQKALRRTAEIYAEEIRKRAGRPTFKHARGSLKHRIVARPARSFGRHRAVWWVQMPYYALFVEYGRPAGKWPPQNQKIVRWAKLEHTTPYWLRKMIGKHGTKPHPFIRPAMRVAHKRCREELFKTLDKSIKKDLKR